MTIAEVRMRKVFVVVAAAAFVLTGAETNAIDIALHVQAPINLGNPKATTLNLVENYGNQPEFSASFNVDYDKVEQLIDQQLAAALSSISDTGTAVCDDPCPDVDWIFTLTHQFQFVDANQPLVSVVVSPSGTRRLRVSVANTVRLDLHAYAHAETWLDSESETADVYVVLGVSAVAEVELWPEIKAYKPGTDEPGIDLEFEIVESPQLAFELNDTLVPLGGKFGFLLDLSPVGFLTGGWGFLFGALLGNTAAEIFEDIAEEKFQSGVETALAILDEHLSQIAQEALFLQVKKVTAIRAALLAKKLPGANVTIQELLEASGATIELHHATVGDRLSTSAVTRFSAAPDTTQLVGTVRMPKQICRYLHADVGGGGVVVPMGLSAFNEDLAARVGASCSSVMGAALQSEVFLGGNPRTALGLSAADLPSWQSAGAFMWVGNLKATDGWYECGFSVGQLPKAAVVRIEPSEAAGIRGVADPVRYLVAKLGAGSPFSQALFDRTLQPVAVAVLGGAGKCQSASRGGGLTLNQLERLQRALDPDFCPVCDIARVGIWNHVFEVRNSAAFLETSVGRELESLIVNPPGGPVCAGDCDANGAVDIAELIRGVRTLQGQEPLTACPSLDADGSEAVTINELIAAVNRSAGGCSGSEGTPSPMATPTATRTPTLPVTPTFTATADATAVVVWVEPAPLSDHNVEVRAEARVELPPALADAEFEYTYRFSFREVPERGGLGVETELATGTREYTGGSVFGKVIRIAGTFDFERHLRPGDRQQVQLRLQIGIEGRPQIEGTIRFFVAEGPA